MTVYHNVARGHQKSPQLKLDCNVGGGGMSCSWRKAITPLSEDASYVGNVKSFPVSV